MYTVLAITSHPDDMEIACAGTLLKCKQRGDRVVVCHLSSGNLGHVIIPPDELTVMRAKEAERSAQMAGFEIIHSSFDDLAIYDNNKAARDKVVDVIKAVKPDFIITHAPDDYMPDHTAVSRLVFDASFTATLPNYHTNVPGAAKMVPIYYMDTLAGVNFNPTEFVDVSDFIDKKLQMLECHESQVVSRYGSHLQPLQRLSVRRGLCRGLPPVSGLSEGHHQTAAAVTSNTRRSVYIWILILP